MTTAPAAPGVMPGAAPASPSIVQYDGVADAYEARIVPRFRPIAERLLRATDVRAGDRVLEVGAGTGGLSRLLAPHLGARGSLLLTDVSADMLRVASREVAASAGTRGPTITTLVADLQALPVDDASFDLVVAQMTPLLDSEAGLREAFRVLRPGGRLAVAAWGARYQETALLNIARAAAGHDPYPRPRLHAIAPRLRRIGFTDVRQQTRPMIARHANVEAYLEYRRGFGAVGWDPDRVEVYFATLERTLRSVFAGDEPVTIGWSVTVVTARTPGG